MRIKKIITGGQTGVDRAALDFALAKKILINGWCPKGRRAEDGVIDKKYPLKETPSEAYEQRTEWNVRDSDALLVITKGEPIGGTAHAIRYAESLRKPLFIIDLSKPVDLKAMRNWLMSQKISALGIGGPRESHCPGIYVETRQLLDKLTASAH